MREDIFAGLRNAIERGATLEQAVQSFINAGYNPVEVKQAAESIDRGNTSLESLNRQQPNELIRQNQQPKSPFVRQQESSLQSTATQQPSAFISKIPQQVSAPISPEAYSSPSRRLSVYQSAPNRTGNKGIAVIVILIIVLLLLIGGLIYMIFNGQELLDKLFNTQ